MIDFVKKMDMKRLEMEKLKDQRRMKSMNKIRAMRFRKLRNYKTSLILMIEVKNLSLASKWRTLRYIFVTRLTKTKFTDQFVSSSLRQNGLVLVKI